MPVSVATSNETRSVPLQTEFPFTLPRGYVDGLPSA